MDPVTMAAIISAVGGLLTSGVNAISATSQSERQKQQAALQAGQSQKQTIQAPQIGQQRSQPSPMDAAAFIAQLGGY